MCYDRAMKKLLASPSNDHERAIFGKIAELLDGYVSIDLITDCPDASSDYAGQLVLTNPPIPDLASHHLPVDLTPDQLTQAELVNLIWSISQFVSSTDQLPLDQLPLHIALTDQANQITYHNGKPKDPFLPLDTDPEPVPDWIIKEMKTRPDHAVHLLLPSISFEQILIHSYQGLYDQGQFKGIFQQVQDIKPILASYLKETGQALVGWSDTVSGASIKNDTFDGNDY